MIWNIPQDDFIDKFGENQLISMDYYVIMLVFKYFYFLVVWIKIKL